MQGMQREQPRHRRAAPDRASRALEQQVEQQRVDGVDQQAREVMPAGLQPEELRVEQVRQPSDRLPVATQDGAEGCLLYTSRCV